MSFSSVTITSRKLSKGTAAVERLRVGGTGAGGCQVVVWGQNEQSVLKGRAAVTLREVRSPGQRSACRPASTCRRADTAVVPAACTS